MESSHSWSSAHAWKACIPKGIKGSNPLLSAKNHISKNQKIDKVHLAKKFLDIVKKDKSKVKLSQTTTDNFKTIFEKIGEYFNHAD